MFFLTSFTKTFEFCSKPYCGLLIPQSLSSHLDAGRLISFFIWHSSCCQLHTSVAIKDKITVSMYMNIHAAAFLLGCLPAQRCGAVYCHVLKSLHLDVVLTAFQTSFHMQLSRASRPDIVWALPSMLVTLDVPACCPADLEVEEKETCWWPWRSSVLPSRLHCAERACLLS